MFSSCLTTEGIINSHWAPVRAAEPRTASPLLRLQSRLAPHRREDRTPGALRRRRQPCQGRTPGISLTRRWCSSPSKGLELPAQFSCSEEILDPLSSGKPRKYGILSRYFLFDYLKENMGKWMDEDTPQLSE